MGEDERRCDVVADPAGAGGDSAQRSAAAGEQGEAAFAQASCRAQQGVVGLVVRGECLSVAGLLDRGVDALAGAVVAGVGEGGGQQCPFPMMVAE